MQCNLWKILLQLIYFIGVTSNSFPDFDFLINYVQPIYNTIISAARDKLVLLLFINHQNYLALENQTEAAELSRDHRI